LVPIDWEEDIIGEVAKDKGTDLEGVVTH